MDDIVTPDEEDEARFREADRYLAERFLGYCDKYPLTLGSLMRAAEFIALCTHYGIQPKELLAAGLNHFAHPELIDKLEEYFPDE